MCWNYIRMSELCAQVPFLLLPPSQMSHFVDHVLL